MRRLGALAIALIAACTPAALAPSPPAGAGVPTTAPRASPTRAGGATAPAIPTAPTRMTLSNEAAPGVAGKWVTFRLPGEPQLRVISFDVAANGVAPIEVNDAVWSQSPYGLPIVVGTSVLSYGQFLGSVPWSVGEFTWSADGRLLCAVTPESRASGAPMRLQTAAVDRAAKTVAAGFGTFGDNAGYRVLACDEGTDRAVVALLGQGLYVARLWVFALSTGAVVRSVRYDGVAVGRWVAASPDGALLAESERATNDARWTSTIRRSDDGAEQGVLDGMRVRGFSGDNALVVADGEGTAIVEWSSRRRVWSVGAPYAGHLAEPAGRRFAVGARTGDGPLDLYVVDGDGKAVLLPVIAAFSAGP